MQAELGGAGAALCFRRAHSTTCCNFCFPPPAPQWAAGASRQNLEELARWAPEMALAAGTVPPLKASTADASLSCGCSHAHHASLNGIGTQASCAAASRCDGSACGCGQRRPVVPQVHLLIRAVSSVPCAGPHGALLGGLCDWAGCSGGQSCLGDGGPSVLHMRWPPQCGRHRWEEWRNVRYCIWSTCPSRPPPGTLPTHKLVAALS